MPIWISSAARNLAVPFPNPYHRVIPSEARNLAFYCDHHERCEEPALYCDHHELSEEPCFAWHFPILSIDLLWR